MFGDEQRPHEERSDRRPMLQSVVAHVEGGGSGEEPGDRRKRPAGGELPEEKADVKRRNKRLFGAILGTLQRFSREEQEMRSTAAAQRRAELEQRAEQKKVEAVAEAKRQAREEMRQMREGEAARRAEMRTHAVCARLDTLYAGRLARLDKLSTHFLRTATGPALYWCPAKPCRELAAVQERQRQEHEAEKERLRQELEAEKAEVAAAIARRHTRPGVYGPGLHAGEGLDGQDEAGEGEQGAAPEGEAMDADGEEEREAERQAGGSVQEEERHGQEEVDVAAEEGAGEEAGRQMEAEGAVEQGAGVGDAEDADALPLALEEDS